MEEDLSIEVGPRDNPYIWLLRKDLLPPQGQVLYVDKEHAWLESMEDLIEVGAQVGIEGRESRIQGLADEIPLPDESTSLVFASNLFGSQGYLEMIPEGGFSNDVNTLDNESIAKEWSRILKDGGRVVLVENSTPPEGSKRLELIDIFEKNGLRLTENHTGKDSLLGLYEDNELATKLSRNFREEAFGMVFEKSSEG